MKVLFFAIILVVCVYLFRHEIIDKIEGEVKRIPKIVQEYNQKVLGSDYFRAEQRIALELTGICSQHSAWINDDDTRIFAQNCADAKSVLK
jgi:hypothetical protein